MLPLMILGAAAMAVAVGVQHFFIFRSPVIAAAVTAVLAAAAWFLTRGSLRALENAMRYSLGLLTQESGALYKEIDL